MLDESHPPVISDDGVELIFKIPYEVVLTHLRFTTQTKVKAITIIGGPDGTAPAKVKLYKDVEAIDMSLLEDTTPTQVKRMLTFNRFWSAGRTQGENTNTH
jgi:hypothetical protein